MNTRIRVGLIVNSPKIGGWQRFILDRLAADPRFEGVLVVELNAAGTSAGRRNGAWRFVDRVEAELSRRAFHRTFERRGIHVDGRVDLPQSWQSATWLKAATHLRDDGTRGPSDADIQAVQSEKLDVIVNFASGPLPRGLLSMAEHGVWSYSFAGRRLERGGPPGFWDFFDHEPITVATVRCVRDDGQQGTVLKEGTYRTFRFSWNENRRRLLWKSAWLLIDALSDFANTGRMPVERVRQDMPLEIVSGRLDNIPNGRAWAVAIFKIIYRLVVHSKYQILFDPQWRTYVFEGKVNNRVNVSEFRPIEPNPMSFMADPFPIRRNGKKYIFFEEYLFSSRKGVISYVELPNIVNGPDSPITSTSHRIIETPYHLSYPFLLEFADQVYMIPETSANRTIELWECTEFPHTWQRKKTLFKDISAADTTLLQWGNRWWMFTNIDRSNTNDHMSELHIFHADHPFDGAWHPHARNPVVSDARRARMAGGFIVTDEGRLVRCCQALGMYYGSAVLLCEVVELTETAYKENPFDRIEPNWQGGVHRTHHFASKDGLLALDGCWDVWKAKRYLGSAMTRSVSTRG